MTHIGEHSPGQMSSRRSFSADKQTYADIYRATRRHRVTSVRSLRDVLPRHASANRGLTDNDLPRERKRRESGPRAEERASESAMPAGRPAGRSVDPAATIYHAAVASIVLLVLRYASRREKAKRETLFLSLRPRVKESATDDERVCNMCLSRALLPPLTSSLCFYFSRFPLFFSLRYNVILPTLPGAKNRMAKNLESDNGLDLFL